MKKPFCSFSCFKLSIIQLCRDTNYNDPSRTKLITGSDILFCHLQVLIYSPDGRCLFKYLAYESGLGVKTVAWSLCGLFLAVGSYDQAVRTLNHLTWKTFAEFSHAGYIRSPCNAAIYKVTQSIILLTCYITTAAWSKFTSLSNNHDI